ncbi:MAG: glutamate formimidoyltransferase, partial [Candidatus Heimdallarchaeota archaeon]
IDMTKHKGQHPRIGATDVVPFVPAQNMTMKECDALAKRYAEAMAEAGVPIYLYEDSATRPDRKNIDNIRVGDYEGLRYRCKNAFSLFKY